METHVSTTDQTSTCAYDQLFRPAAVLSVVYFSAATTGGLLVLFGFGNRRAAIAHRHVNFF
jgi:hypothetical protein